MIPPEVRFRFAGRKYDVQAKFDEDHDEANRLFGQSCPVDLYAAHLENLITHCRVQCQDRPRFWDDILTLEQERQVEAVMLREHTRLVPDVNGRRGRVGGSAEDDLIQYFAVRRQDTLGQHKWFIGDARASGDPRDQVPIQDMPRSQPGVNTGRIRGLAAFFPDQEIIGHLVDGMDPKDVAHRHNVVCHNHGSGLKEHRLVDQTHREEVEAGRIREYRLLLPGQTVAEVRAAAAVGTAHNSTVIRRGAVAGDRREGIVDVYPAIHTPTGSVPKSD